MAKFTSIRIVLSLAAKYDLIVHQMDVKTAFLNGELDEDIYMIQPEGYVEDSNLNLVCKLVESWAAGEERTERRELGERSEEHLFT